MWRKLFKIFGAKVVVTTDFDGETRWRFVFKDSKGDYRVRGIACWVRLLEDGTVERWPHGGSHYVRKWRAE